MSANAGEVQMEIISLKWRSANYDLNKIKRELIRLFGGISA